MRRLGPLFQAFQAGAGAPSCRAFQPQRVQKARQTTIARPSKTPP